MPANILIIDDEESIRLGCLQTLEQENFLAKAVADGFQGLQLAKEESFDLVLLDLKMPGINGMEVLQKLKAESPNTQVIVITGYASIASAVEAMKFGAFDYLPKPFAPDLLLAHVHRALEHQQLAMENLCLRTALKEKAPNETMVGESPAMEQVIKLIKKVAPTDATVLLIGETGVGKELAARALHHYSLRRDKPFLTVDCGSLVETLFESELFGHVRGAFTGATETTLGKFELAHTGTLFLDEIANIPPELQAKLLRVLQEREFTKVGGSKRIKVDVRIIAATNLDLLHEFKQGEFRQDLFYRLSTVPIQIPPLRERREDIRALAQYFLKKHGAKRNPQVKGISEQGLQLLMEYDWPGNVRELENAIERGLVMAESEIIGPDDLYFYGPTSQAAAGDESQTTSSSEGHLAEVEKREIGAALQKFDWQVTKAADYLGINRKTLREKIRKYHLDKSAALS